MRGGGAVAGGSVAEAGAPAEAAVPTVEVPGEGLGDAGRSPGQHRTVPGNRFPSPPGSNLSGMYLLAQTGELVDRLPDQVKDKASQLVEQVRANPVLMWVLVAVGAVAALVFVVGVIKHAFKSAILAGVLSAGAWYWYFNIR
jgi:hypothetical protein